MPYINYPQYKVFGVVILNLFGADGKRRRVEFQVSFVTSLS